MIDPDCNDYENAMCSLELAKKYGLQVEVFCTAMAYYRNNKTLTVSKAFKAAQYDWDVCVPLSKEEKESPEEIEEFNNHMRTLAKAKELGEVVKVEGVKEMRWPEDFDSKH